MRITADRGRCLGLGNCEKAAPGVFEIDDDGVVLLLAENVDPDQLHTVTEAVGRCPTEALSLVED